MREECSVPVCDRPVFSRGWCCGHYKRWKKTGQPGSSPIRSTRRANIPVEPLLAWLRSRDLSPNALKAPHPAVYRQLQRSNFLTGASADNVACEFFGVHPIDIWPDWYELTDYETSEAA